MKLKSIIILIMVIGMLAIGATAFAENKIDVRMHRWDRMDNMIVASFKITNKTTSDIESFMLSIGLYDANGKLVGSGMKPVIDVPSDKSVLATVLITVMSDRKWTKWEVSKTQIQLK